ncbi:MAG: thioredoxin family protein [Elusimicrobiota bacterium]
MRALFALLAAAAAAVPAYSGSVSVYSSSRFENLQSKDRTVMLHFYSPTSRVCLAQVKILDRIVDDPGAYVPAVLSVDFETAAGLRDRFDVKAPGALLLFKGREMVGDSVGLYTERDIRAFIRDSRMAFRSRPGPRVKRVYRPKR